MLYQCSRDDPWRTLSGRQQLYQDHEWMRAYGESLVVYRPPIDTKAIEAVKGKNRTASQKSAELPDASPKMGYSLNV